MQVVRPELQHQVMIEAVENHIPEVIVIDEIGTEREALAARTIAERGVQLVGTAHGNSIENLIKNPTLCDLVGGIQSVTLGDEEAERRHTQKSILERKAPPTFEIAVEMRSRQDWVVHENLADTVDSILLGHQSWQQVRTVDDRARMTRNLETARVILTQRGHAKKDSKEEARLAVERVVIPLRRPMDLLPRSAQVRKMQHQLVDRYRLHSQSMGSEPERYLCIYPA